MPFVGLQNEYFCKNLLSLKGGLQHVNEVSSHHFKNINMKKKILRIWVYFTNKFAELAKRK